MQQGATPQLSVKRVSRLKQEGTIKGKIIVYICLSLWAISTILPLLWVFNNSFKASADVVTKSFTPAFMLNASLDNYIRAFDLVDVAQSYLNSLIMSGGALFFVLLFGAMAAYILSRFTFKLKGIIYSVLVMSLLIPAFATVLPVYEILVALELVNTRWALIIVHTAGFLAFATIVIAAYMSTIPKELEEAAWIDGCGRIRMFTRIFIPLSAPAFSSSGVFVFLWSYNDLFSSLIFVQQNAVRPIVVLLSYVSSQYGTDFGLMATAVMITVIPVLIVYIFAQSFIEKGLTEGAVKG